MNHALIALLTLTLLAPAASAAEHSLLVMGADCFGRDERVEAILQEKLADQSLSGRLEVDCFRTHLGIDEGQEWILVETDAELTGPGHEPRHWRAAVTLHPKANRRNDDSAALAAENLALQMQKQPQGQGQRIATPLAAEGPRPLGVFFQISRLVPGGCKYVDRMVELLGHTQLLADLVTLKTVGCAQVMEEHLDRPVRGMAFATEGLTTQTDLVVQLTSGTFWTSDRLPAVLGVARILGELPVVILRAQNPMDPGDMSRVLAHELGHLVGIPHVDAFDLMYPMDTGRGRFTLTEPLMRAGLRRHFARPWRRPLHYFDDICSYLREYETTITSGRVPNPGDHLTAMAGKLLTGSRSEDRSCQQDALTRLCERGEGSACLLLGEAADAGLLPEATPSRERYDRACALDNGEGCQQLARSWLDAAETSPGDLALAEAAARKAMTLAPEGGLRHTRARSLLAQSLVRAQRCSEAKEVWPGELSDPPEDPSYGQALSFQRERLDAELRPLLAKNCP